MNDNVEHLSDQRSKKDSESIKDAIKRAKQHVRNVGAENLDEPEGFASGDMKKFLDDPEGYEKDSNNDSE
jgi:hypothetical protein